MPRIIFILLTILLTADVLFAATSTVVTLPQEIRVKGESAALGDIAKIRSTDKALVEKLKNINICRVPSPGQYIRLSQATLKFKIQSGGIDLSQITIDMPAYVKIYADFKKIESDDMVKAALDYIKKRKLSDNPAELKVTRKPGDLVAKNGKIEFRCEEAPSGNSSIIAVYVDVLCDGKSVGKKRISFKDESAHAVNNEKKGETSAEDSKTSIKEGAVVKAGDQLEVTIIRKNIRVTAMGTARQNGKAGQMIRIKLDDTKKILNARLIDEKHAEVEIP